MYSVIIIAITICIKNPQMVQKFGRILALLFINTSRNQTRPKLAFKCPKRLHTFNKEEKKKIRASEKGSAFYSEFYTAPVCNVHMFH